MRERESGRHDDDAGVGSRFGSKMRDDLLHFENYKFTLTFVLHHHHDAGVIDNEH
jgi:hypothetical protein